MIDPSFGTAVVAPYPMTMQELEVKYRELEQALQRKTQDWEFVRQELTTARTQIYELED